MVIKKRTRKRKKKKKNAIARRRAPGYPGEAFYITHRHRLSSLSPIVDRGIKTEIEKG
jgi:hypothetical protein